MLRKVLVLTLVSCWLLLGAKCNRAVSDDEAGNQETGVEKIYSQDSALEVVQQTSTDLGWHEAWYKEIRGGGMWAVGGSKWATYSEGVIAGKGLLYYFSPDLAKWEERKANHCTADNWVETKFGKTCCNNDYTVNVTGDDWHLAVFPKPHWAVMSISPNDDSKCSGALNALNVFWDNLEEVK